MGTVVKSRLAYDQILIILGLLAAFSLSPIGRGIAGFCEAIVIGWPIMVCMAASPFLFIFLLIAKFIHLRLIKGSSIINFLCTGILTLVFLGIIPTAVNIYLWQEATQIIKEDRDLVKAPGKIQTIALFIDDDQNTIPICADLCASLLLDGKANAVMLPDVPYESGKPRLDMKAIKYSLHKMDVCPAPVYDVAVKEDGIGKSSYAVLMSKKKEGFCLVEEKTTLSAADAILVFSRIKEDGFIHKGYKEAYYKDGNQFSLNGRKTSLSVDMLFPILIPTYVEEPGVGKGIGFLRQHTTFFGDSGGYGYGFANEFLDSFGLSFSKEPHRNIF